MMMPLILWMVCMIPFLLFLHVTAQTADDLNCCCDQNDDTEDCMSLSTLKKGGMFHLFFYTYFFSAIINDVN